MSCGCGAGIAVVHKWCVSVCVGSGSNVKSCGLRRAVALRSRHNRIVWLVVSPAHSERAVRVWCVVRWCGGGLTEKTRMMAW